MPGRETESLAIDCLQSHGFEVYQPPHAKYREQDVFGEFDLLAFGHDQELRIQIKGGRDASGIEGWFERVRPFEEALTDCHCQFWHRKDDSWRIALPTADGYRWAFDGRSPSTSPYSRIRDVILPE